MQLLWITPGFVYPLVGGQSIRTYHMLKELHALGVEITAVTIREPGSDGAFLEEMGKFCREVIPVPVDPDRSRSMLNKVLLRFRSMPATMIRYRDAELARTVNDLLESRSFDALMCDQLHMASYCHHAAVHKILNTDDPLYIQLSREAAVCPDRGRALRMKVEAWKYRRYERRMFRAFDHVLFVSAVDRDRVQDDFGCRNIAIIPQGVDMDFFRPGGPGLEPAPKAPYILITGMMNYTPNAAAAVYFVEKVLPLVREKHPDIGCMIVGAYPTYDVQRLSRIPGVTVTGFVDDVRPYIRSAAVYAAPAISGTGIKNKVLQAMAMEKGIVATPLSMDGIPQAVDEEHVLIAEGPEALAERTCRLLDNPEEAAALGRRAGECIRQHYTWPAIVRELYELLKRPV